MKKFIMFLVIGAMAMVSTSPAQAQATKSTAKKSTTAKKQTMKQPAANTGIRVNHIALYVTNLGTSTNFYKDIIGLDTIPEPFHDGKHTWFSIGDKAHLHLIEGRTNEPVSGKNTHLCFSTGSFDALLKKLADQQVSFENWAGEKGTFTKRVDGIRQIWFRDPDGYWIEVNDDF